MLIFFSLFVFRYNNRKYDKEQKKEENVARKLQKLLFNEYMYF